MTKKEKQTIKEVIEATEIHLSLVKLAIVKKNSFGSLADIQLGLEISLSKLENLLK